MQKHVTHKISLAEEGKDESLLARTTMAERFAMVAVLRQNAWAFQGIDIARTRLQRHVVRTLRLTDDEMARSYS